MIYAVHVYRVGTGRFPELEPVGSQSRVYGPTEYSLEWLICVMCGFLGNSLSFELTVLVFVVSGTSDDRGKAPA